jgi:hypothetical protein
MPATQEEVMNKKLGQLKGLDDADLAIVTGGQSGTAIAHQIKNQQIQNPDKKNTPFKR